MKLLSTAQIIVSVIIMGSLSHQLNARVRTAQSEREFDQYCNKSNLMVALLYRNGKEFDKRGNNGNNPLLRMYEKVSSKRLYDDADVTFIKVNLNNKGSDILAQRYSIGTVPSFILFDHGQVLRKNDGSIAMLTGVVSDTQLHQFINNYFSVIIHNLIQEKEQRRTDRIEASKNEADPYFYPATIYTPSGDISSWKQPTKNKYD